MKTHCISTEGETSYGFAADPIHNTRDRKADSTLTITTKCTAALGLTTRAERTSATLSPRWRDSAIAACAAVFAAVLHAQSIYAQPLSLPRYNVVEFGRLDNPGSSAVVGRINSFLEVVGGFQSLDRSRGQAAFVLSILGLEAVLGDRGVDYSVAYAINDQHEMVGAFNGATALRPFRAVHRVTFEVLPLLPGDTGGTAHGINQGGEAAGVSSGSGGVRAVVWARNGEPTALQGLPNSTTTRALALNDAGDVVGVSDDGEKRAVLWRQKGPPIDLGTLPGFTSSEAVSINNRGDIAGVARGNGAFTTVSRAVLWDRGQSIRDLGALPGGDDSRARDVNASGMVVGTSTSARGDRAFVWTAASGMIDLNSAISAAGLVLTDALGINARGDIVAIGHDGDPHAPVGHEDHDDHEQPLRIVVLTRLL